MGRIVIVGSGITGLYTALVLARKGYATNTIVLAKHLPGDSSLEYVSPVAGAHWSSRVFHDSNKELEWNKASFRMLKGIFSDYGEEAGLLRVPEIELWAEGPPPALITETLREISPDFEVIDDKQFLEQHGAVYGHKFLAYNFNTPKFLRFLQKLLSDQGVTFIRQELADINDAFKIPSSDVVFNCTGLGVTKLAGVNDPRKNFPVRGQAVLVRAPQIKENIGLAAAGFSSYIVPRPFSNGLVIVGGSHEPGNSSGDARWPQSSLFLDRATRMWPQLVQDGPLEIIGSAVGLRPGREGGPRVECLKLADGRKLIHNYGASGAGYQMGLGMAVEAVSLMEGSPSKLLARI